MVAAVWSMSGLSVLLVSRVILSCNFSDMQWNLSIEDTIGTQLAVLYREVSLIQRYVDLYTAFM